MGESLILDEVVEKRIKDAPLSFDRYYMYIGDKKAAKNMNSKPLFIRRDKVVAQTTTICMFLDLYEMTMTLSTTFDSKLLDQNSVEFHTLAETTCEQV